MLCTLYSMHRNDDRKQDDLSALEELRWYADKDGSNFKRDVGDIGKESKQTDGDQWRITIKICRDNAHDAGSTEAKLINPGHSSPWQTGTSETFCRDSHHSC